MNHVATAERERIFGTEPDTPAVMKIRMQAAEEAAQMIAQASEQAEIMCAMAVDEGRREGYSDGLAQGRADGLRAAEAEVAAMSKALRNLTEQVATERERLLEETEIQIVAFALEIARKIVRDEAQMNREVAVAAIRTALRRIGSSQSVRIRVNAADLESVRSRRVDFVEFLDGIQSVEIIEDRRVDMGGAVIETDEGTIDSTVHTQFTAISEAIRACIAEVG